MYAKTRKALVAAGVVLLSSAVARAQQMDAIGTLLQQRAAASQPPAELSAANGAQALAQPPMPSDFANFRQAVESARRGDVNGARAAIAAIGDRATRKTATWVLVDLDGDSLSFAEVDQARRELMAWPHPAKRQASAEKLIETSGMSPKQIVDWFDGLGPSTPQGAMALAQAYRYLGERDQAAQLIKTWWRTKSFEADVQRTMLLRFGDMLTQDDHIARADVLLYGAQGPAARDMIALLPPDQQQAAYARIALRNNTSDANELVNALPPSLARTPGVAFERAAYLRRHGLTELAVAQLPDFPKTVYTPDQAERVWDERHQMVLAALKAGDSKAAYEAAADGGFTFGPQAAEAEFYAGWIALTRLHDPEQAQKHFAVIDRVGASPITRARALYWQGRAAEARGDHAGAQGFYAAGAQHITTFYGQLSAEKIGQRVILARDVEVTPGDRARFDASDVVQGARLLHDEGERDLFRSYVCALADVMTTASDEALLIDLVRGYGEQDLSMRVARNAAQKGFILPERAYPMRSVPPAMGAPEAALVLAITRQESGFDPYVRSSVGARGMMQLMPATAAIIARRNGLEFSAARLDEPDYNMRLGSSFLGELVTRFSGSYVMAVAAYNAGPGRPSQWAAYCGDPRGGSTDPIDFIECIPFSETRNYVMRVLEGMEIYRAKLNGGSTPATLSADLSRGGYGYHYPSSVAARSPAASTTVAEAEAGS